MNERDKWQLVLENISGRSGPTVKGQSSHSWWLKSLVVIGAGVLVARVFFLQVVLGEQQAVVADGNRLERRVLRADRGVIKDRNGLVLARNVVNEDKTVREYPYGEIMAHVIGYSGEVNELEVADGYEVGEMVGKLGIEKGADKTLRGTAGEELVEVNARGEEVGVIGRRETVPGRVVELNIDGELSKEIYRILSDREIEKGDYRGAVVVSRAGTGEILALTSWPSFDSNLFSGLKSEGRYKSAGEVVSDAARQPMFDRAVGGSYPPGSIYKLVTAVAGLEEGKIDATTIVLDEGEIKIDSFRFGNWYYDQYGKTEGEIGLVRALARSNDIFFYKVGEWVGVEKLGEWSRKLGLGRKLGIGIEAEASGRVPDPLWKEKLTGERWFLGNTYHMAIGQGDLAVTPLQGNMMTAAVVSGKLCDPKLVKGEKSCVDVGIGKSERALVTEGMIAACQEGGTAFSFFDFPVRVACKTGTSQQGGEKAEPHSWITAVVPRVRDQNIENREQGEDYESGVVITVLLEASGEGSREAGPVATMIAKYVVEKGI